MQPRHGLVLSVEPGGETVVGRGPVKPVLRVVLARPDDFDGRVHRFGQVHRFGDEIRFQPAAEAAAQQRRMDPDFLFRESSGFGSDFLRARLILRRCPHLALVGADVRSAVHRLHRRMMQERNGVHRVDLFCG